MRAVVEKHIATVAVALVAWGGGTVTSNLLSFTRLDSEVAAIRGEVESINIEIARNSEKLEVATKERYDAGRAGRDWDRQDRVDQRQNERIDRLIVLVHGISKKEQ